ncbi:hypothetical protein A4A49_13116 [Nicotiana attenuata]|uniref:Carboxypeptidase A inhibitor-like domain-containing protein n=1 Tax=Nicotiana attenuata TaxID=49451 RepID=A0A314KPB1_NICAT|nr:hypothetical protein A4A49_13116 [Nicotiana attenuata]
MASLCSTFKLAFIFTALLFTAHLTWPPKTYVMAVRDISPELRAIEQNLLLIPNNRIITCLARCDGDLDCSDATFCKYCRWDVITGKTICGAIY